MASDSAVMAVIRASRPSFRTLADRLAFAVHATFLASGYSLIATGRAALSENPPTDGEEVGIEGWNEVEEAYGFVYSKMEKGLKKSVLVKCLQLGNVLAVDAMNLNRQGKEPLHLEINIDDYSSDVAGRPGNYAEFYKNFQGLLDSLNSGLLAKLDAKKKTSSSSRGLNTSHSADEDRRNVIVEPPVGFPGQHYPHSPGLVYPSIPGSGFDDLFPGPGAGVYPDRGSGMGGSMFVGPNDPRFFGSDERFGLPGGIPPGHPPGSRFDPYGPPGVPGFEPGRFIRRPRPPGGGTHPDVQHFPDTDYI